MPLNSVAHAIWQCLDDYTLPPVLGASQTPAHFPPVIMVMFLELTYRTDLEFHLVAE